MVDFQITFLSLTYHWWLLVVRSSLSKCLVTALGILSICQVCSMAKVVPPLLPLTFSVTGDTPSSYAGKYLPPSFLLSNPSPSWQLCLLVYAQTLAHLDRHPGSTPPVSIFYLVQLFSSPSCELSKLSFTALATQSLLLEAAWRKYHLNCLLGKAWALY